MEVEKAVREGKLEAQALQKEIVYLKSALQESLQGSKELELDLQTVRTEMEAAKRSAMQTCKTHFAKLFLSAKNSYFKHQDEIAELKQRVTELEDELSSCNLSIPRVNGNGVAQPAVVRSLAL